MDKNLQISYKNKVSNYLLPLLRKEGLGVVDNKEDPRP